MNDMYNISAIRHIYEFTKKKKKGESNHEPKTWKCLHRDGVLGPLEKLCVLQGDRQEWDKTEYISHCRYGSKTML